MEAAIREVRERVEGGEPMSAAIRTVAANTGLGRRALYEVLHRG